MPFVSLPASFSCNLSVIAAAISRCVASRSDIFALILLAPKRLVVSDINQLDCDIQIVASFDEAPGHGLHRRQVRGNLSDVRIFTLPTHPE